MYRLIICPNLLNNVICLINKKITKKKCQNCHNLFLRAETACPDASKFESFIPLVSLVLELELFKPTIEGLGA